MVLYKPQVVQLSREVTVKDYLAIPALRDKCLVTETVKCKAYAFYLSEGGAFLLYLWGFVDDIF